MDEIVNKEPKKKDGHTESFIKRFFIFTLIILGFLMFTNNASATTNVYYSVGQNTADHSSGGNVSITSGIATFSVPQIATNLGVGDRLTVGVNVYYLAQKISTTQWNVVTKLGIQPSDLSSTSVTSIAHEFASLSAAIVGSKNSSSHISGSNLITADVILNIPCYYDSGPDTTAVLIINYTTGPSNYIKIYTPNNTLTEVNQSQRHNGNWNTNTYRLEVANNSAIDIESVGGVRIDGLQIWLTSTNNNNQKGITVWAGSGSSDFYISNNIVRGYISNTYNVHNGISIYTPGYGGTARIWNNIVYDIKGPSGAYGINPSISNTTYYIYNNTVYNSTIGYEHDTGTGTGIVIAKNNIAQGNTTGYVGTYDASSSNNISQDATSPNSLLRNKTVSFIDTPNKDFHLASSDTIAKDSGIDLHADPNLAFNTDIDGDSRPQGSEWDIGADEFVQTDFTPPAISEFSMETRTNSRIVDVISFVANDPDDAVGGYLINESSSIPSGTDPNWSPSIPSTYTFSSSGTKTVYAWAKDLIGNISASTSQIIFVQPITYYIDSSSGNDNNDGISTITPWKTIGKVMSVTVILHGDSVLFKRGSVWSLDNGGGTLIPINGDASGNITYGAYGTGSKPQLTMAKDVGNSFSWTDIGGNIWSAGDSAANATTTGSELLSNPSFDTDTSGWSFSVNGAGVAATGARTTTSGEYDSSPGGYKVNVTTSGSTQGNIQLSTTQGMSVTAGEYYKFSFKAKATSNLNLSYIRFLKMTSPYSSYATSDGSASITSNWQTYNVIFQSNITATDGVIYFLLGKDIPNNTTLYIDSLSFKKVSEIGTFLSTDVGNIIMKNKSIFGTKVWDSTSLDSQGKFWYDIDNKVLKMYSTQNPATFYDGDITLVMRDVIISLDNKRYVTLDGLDVSMGGQVGISMYASDNIIIKNCDVSYIGGGDQYMDKVQTVRYGNGIQLWGSGHDISVFNNKLWQIYDAALTPQGSTLSNIYNLYFYNNLIWDTEYGIEYWERPASTTVDSLYFDNNTIIDSGGGWAHNQRPNGVNGRAFLAYNNPATQTNIFARNNILYNASEGNVKLWGDNWLSNFNLDYNHYDKNSKVDIVSPALSYSINSQLNNWQSSYGKDLHSLVANQAFVDYVNKNLALAYNSPDIDAGTNNSYRTTDFVGNPIYGTPDIGAYEYQPPHNLVASDTIDIGAGARIYADGKFRDLGTTNSILAHLKITPSSGAFATYDATTTRPAYLDITNLTNWTNSHKTWTESNAQSSNMITNHTIGDLEVNKYYNITVTNALPSTITGIDGITCNVVDTNAVCKSNDSGELSFQYNGGYSTHTFDIQEKVTPVSSGSSALSRYNNLISMGNTQAAENLKKEFPNQISNNQIPLTLSTSPTPTVTSTPSTPFTPIIINRILKLKTPRMWGNDIKALQTFLNTKGYDSGTPDGNFGPKTQAAVIAFQKANGLTPDGVVGPNTLKYLNGNQTTATTAPTLTQSTITRILKLSVPRMIGDDVLALQTYLNTNGYDVGALDGVLGTKTKTAIIAFQTANSLTPDGIVGAKTREMMK